jgi:hypothetical protein
MLSVSVLGFNDMCRLIQGARLMRFRSVVQRLAC